MASMGRSDVDGVQPMTLTRRQLLRSAASVAAVAAVPAVALVAEPKPVSFRLGTWEGFRWVEDREMFVSTDKRQIREFIYSLETEDRIGRVYPRFDGGRLELLDRPLRPT